jgi:hypothetical protein
MEEAQEKLKKQTVGLQEANQLLAVKDEMLRSFESTIEQAKIDLARSQVSALREDTSRTIEEQRETIDFLEKQRQELDELFAEQEKELEGYATCRLLLTT